MNDGWPFGGGCSSSTCLEDMGLAAGCYGAKPKPTGSRKEETNAIRLKTRVREGVEIVRPAGSRKKDLQVGMRLYAGKEGRIEARLRIPKGGGRILGVITELATPGKPAQIEVTV